MFLLFETILLKNGKPVNLNYHQQRVNESRLYFWGLDCIDLHEYIPQTDDHGEFRCRIDYNETIVSVIKTPINTPEVNSLRVVFSNDVEYEFKYSDRRQIERLFSQRKLSDDILIVKNGRITDSSRGNIVFSTGDKLITPSYPLLKGTQRASLLERNIIQEEDIRLENISNFKGWQCVNALSPFDESRFKPISAISLP